MDIKLVFDKEKIDRELIKTLDEIGIINPTEIQAKAIPYLIEKKDIIAQSNTGTGKTLAFGIPIVQNIKEKTREIEALVVVPTRELSQQVTKDLKEIATYKQ